MKTLFTDPAIEYLVGSEIEKRIPGANVRVLSKKNLLISDSQNVRSVPVELRSSRDYLVTYKPYNEEIFQKELLACGWWTHKRNKIQESKADFWILVLRASDPKKWQYIIISPQELNQRLSTIHGSIETLYSYFWVTEKGKCWETRGLSKNDLFYIANNAYVNEDRNFSMYLNAWKILEQRLIK